MLKILWLKHFSTCFEKGCNDKEHVTAGCTSVTSKVYVFNSASDYPWAKAIRKTGASLSWLFFSSYDLITEEVMGHNIWQVGEVLSLDY